MSQRPVVRRSVAGNVFTTMYHFWTSGDTEPAVATTHDCTIVIAKGRVAVIADGVRNEFTAPQIVTRKANKQHTLEAITDNCVVYSVAAVRDYDGVLLEPDNVPEDPEELKTLLASLRA